MRTSILIAFLALVSTLNVVAECEETAPNVVILYADDLGFGDLGCYNPESRISTPNLDQLAKTGMRFTNGHSSSGICTPSRYALLTGRYHWRDFHNIVGAFGPSVIPSGRLTIAGMLKQKGYSTAAIGKWHLGWDWDAIRKPGAEQHEINVGERKRKVWGPECFDWSKPIPGGPLDHGFDHYFGDAVINFPPYCWIKDNRVTAVPDRIIDGSGLRVKEGRSEFRPGPAVEGWDPYENIPATTRHGVEFIQKQAQIDGPFFLYFAFPSPHAPIIPNDEFDGKSKAGPYGDLVFETDHACGKLLKALEDSGQADNTIVIFSSDNGPERYAYARDANFGHWSSHPFRGVKRDMYEGGHRVPFIIRWPGVTKEGTVSDALVSQIDFMATLAAALKFDLPDDSAEDSHDLLSLLQTGSGSPRTSHVHNTFKGKYAIRDGDWLLIDHVDGYHSGRYQDWESRRGYKPDNQSKTELYNLKDDVGQFHELSESNPSKVDQLQSLIKRIREQGHSAPRLSTKKPTN